MNWLIFKLVIFINIKIEPTEVPLNKDGKNEYSPLPNNDVEMPEEFSLDELQKK